MYQEAWKLSARTYDDMGEHASPKRSQGPQDISCFELRCQGSWRELERIDDGGCAKTVCRGARWKDMSS
jgi:hypothetical protein